MEFYDFDILRNIDVNSLLELLYHASEFETKEYHHTRKYILPSGTKIAVTDNKWIDNASGKGSYGAIDLVMYLNSIPIMEAANILNNFNKNSLFGNCHKPISTSTNNNNIPKSCSSTWPIVKSYLINIRKIPEQLIILLYQNSLVWSDTRSNCVFPRDHDSGVYLRGTNDNNPFKQTIGSNGFPYIIPGDDVKIITEAPIDGISLKFYFPSATIISTGGRIGFDKITPYLSNASLILLAQDNDVSGDEQANRIKNSTTLNTIRLKPLYGLKDWNDVLIYDNNKNSM
jgi:hypothetical protein